MAITPKDYQGDEEPLYNIGVVTRMTVFRYIAGLGAPL
jgi:hypothetical protein